MADAQVSGACGSDTMWVRLPSSAPKKNKTNLEREQLSHSKFVF